MAAPVRLNLDVTYVNGAIPLVATNPSGGAPAWFAALDQAQFVSINGDIGSSHAPTVAITVGGAGFVFFGTTLDTAGGFETTIAVGNSVTHEDNDYIEYGTSPTFSTVTPLLNGIDCSYSQSFPTGGATSGRVPVMAYSLGNRCLTSNISGDLYGAARFICPLDVYNGATLVSVTVYFVVGTHSALPAVFPTYRVFKVDAAGNVTPLQTSNTTSGWAGNGFVTYNPTPANFTAWNAVTFVGIRAIPEWSSTRRSTRTSSRSRTRAARDP